jgi:LmbE family N-acetylglucosaminyl deacetylase
MKRSARLLATLLLLVATVLSPIATGYAASTRPPRPLDAAALRLALRKLAVTGNVLYIAAHPDDENTAMLAWLANERLVRTGYLSMTRGDGGQNLIGDEKGERLGVIRTQELLAARRIDGAEQFFTRALDFGFTKNPEETFRIWNHDEILADVVWVIRKFQPDVIITRFPVTGEGGHGHHTASAILAEEAFDAAADPKRFPEQLDRVKPWQTKRLFWNAFMRPGDAPPANALAVDLGSYNVLLGKEYTEIAAESRTMHKSQGFGSEARRGEVLNYLILRKGAPADKDLLEGVPTGWSRLEGASAISSLVEEANRRFDPEQPAAILPQLLAIDDALATLSNDERTAQKREELRDLIRAATGLWVEAIASEPVVTSGEKLETKVMAVMRGNADLTLDGVEIHRVGDGQRVAASTEAAKALVKNRSAMTTLSVDVDAPTTAPYWLVDEPLHEAGQPAGRFNVHDKSQIGRPENAPAYEALFNLSSGGKRFTISTPLLYRWTDRVQGEQYRSVTIAPAVTAAFSQSVFLFPNSAPRDVVVSVTNQSAAAREAEVHLNLPSGWTAQPSSQKVSLAGRGANALATFRLTPSSAASSGSIGVDLRSGEVSDHAARSLVKIDYPHIPIQTLFPTASARAVRSDIKRVGQHIGYIAGSGDEVPRALEQMGYDVHLLTDDEITNHSLQQYDAIVVGVRAFNVRETLENQLAPLLRYVENGGTAVVQYNTVDETLAKVLGPYPLELSRDRVTVEEAPVRSIEPHHRVLETPNKITAADFEGWVQERGLYFASKWDGRYYAVLSSNDPGEKPLDGGLLVAYYGKGVYIVTGYSFFRQLPAGVPGAYRLFANLVSARQKP